MQLWYKIYRGHALTDTDPMRWCIGPDLVRRNILHFDSTYRYCTPKKILKFVPAEMSRGWIQIFPKYGRLRGSYYLIALYTVTYSDCIPGVEFNVRKYGLHAFQKVSILLHGYLFLPLSKLRCIYLKKLMHSSRWSKCQIVPNESWLS